MIKTTRTEIIDAIAPIYLDAPLRGARSSLTVEMAQTLRQHTWETGMTWKTPKIVEVQVGMEINMYVCATRK